MLPIWSSSRHIKCAISIGISVLCLLATLSEGREAEQGQSDEELVPIVKSLAELKQDGSYYFAYEGADGSYREEVGLLRRAASDAAATEMEPELEVSGVYRYVDSNGQHVEVSYVADKHGFVPMGNIIDTEISKTARGRS